MHLQQLLQGERQTGWRVPEYFFGAVALLLARRVTEQLLLLQMRHQQHYQMLPEDC
jgi:hypothetical protein